MRVTHEVYDTHKRIRHGATSDFATAQHCKSEAQARLVADVLNARYGATRYGVRRLPFSVLLSDSMAASILNTGAL